MAQARDSISEQDLLKLSGRLVALDPTRLDRAVLLDRLEVSMSEFLALVVVLEDRCGVVLPDGDLARCETLGDLFDRLRPLAVSNVRTLSGRIDPSDYSGAHAHGQGAPERHPLRTGTSGKRAPPAQRWA